MERGKRAEVKGERKQVQDADSSRLRGAMFTNGHHRSAVHVATVTLWRAHRIRAAQRKQRKWNTSVGKCRTSGSCWSSEPDPSPYRCEC